MLKRYGQAELDKDPKDYHRYYTLKVKGDEADHVVLYSKGNYPSNFHNKTREDKTNERKFGTQVQQEQKSLYIYYEQTINITIH